MPRICSNLAGGLSSESEQGSCCNTCLHIEHIQYCLYILLIGWVGRSMCTVYIWELYKRRRWELPMVKLLGLSTTCNSLSEVYMTSASLGNAVKLHRQGQHGSNLSVLIVCTYSMTLKILKLFLHRCQKTWAESDPSSIADADGMLGMQMPWLLRRSWTAHNLLYCWPVSWRQGNRETESHWDELGRLQVSHDPILLMLVLLWGTQGAAPFPGDHGRP